MSYSAPPPPSYQPAPNHPQATTVLILGILGLVVCQLLGPFAWTMGNRVVGEIDAAGGAYSGRDTANIGRILGIVATALLVLSVLALIFFFGVIGIAATTNSN
jgi:uncharacterized membrane protein YjgN (DUF898 family)